MFRHFNAGTPSLLLSGFLNFLVFAITPLRAFAISRFRDEKPGCSRNERYRS